MPELPDLLYIQKRLAAGITGRSITSLEVRQPVLVRNMLDAPLESVLPGLTVREVQHHGPFLRFGLSREIDIVTNLMLAGRFQHLKRGEKPAGHLCVAWTFDDGSALRLCDEQKMAKLYVCRSADTNSVPRYGTQGVDILSPAFTPEKFKELIAANTRRQVRVVINDHAVLSAIGNAYADEILFEAHIHPKTFTGRLSSDELGRLYDAIGTVMSWGEKMVGEAAQPIHVKVREHMKVRNRKGEPCPGCGTTIRREGVRGHDTFFCPSCQPASRRLFIDWRHPGGTPPEPD
jgi:formamidopyrimidine-DNA glycosylase